MWGILAAIVLRGIFIFAGVALVSRFHWLLYPLGAFLIYTGYKLLKCNSDESLNVENNPALRFCRKYLPLSKDYVSDRFLIHQEGNWLFTPLFVVLIVINFTDVMFATDSIPAIIGVTQDPFIVYTSNIFAVCGLRALYFVLAKMFDRFHLLSYGLAVVLAFIGMKMLSEWPMEQYFHVSDRFITYISLGVVGTTLIGSMLLSLVIPAERESH